MADRTTRQRLWRRGLIAGVVTAVLVVCAGVGWALTYRPTYTATATLLVLPNAKASKSGDAASYYDTLSQGQIVQTFAQVLRARGTPDRVTAAAGGLTRAQVAATDVSVTAVPNTSVISITAQGGDPDVTERVVETLAGRSPHALNALATPYKALTVDSGAGSLTRSGFDRTTLLVAVAAVAVLAGVGAQQLTWLLGNASLRAARRDRREGFGYDTTGFPIVADADRPYAATRVTRVRAARAGDDRGTGSAPTDPDLGG